MKLCAPLGASDVGEMYATALTNLEPAFRTVLGLKSLWEDDDLCHDIAVESREAERMRVSVGELSART